jgi:hypothetical protein
MRDVKEAARDAGVEREYVYMLYSSAAQDVLRGYGNVNWERLREVKRKYDPRGCGVGWLGGILDSVMRRQDKGSDLGHLVVL